jgi:hypothetical protein
MSLASPFFVVTTGLMAKVGWVPHVSGLETWGFPALSERFVCVHRSKKSSASLYCAQSAPEQIWACAIDAA